MEPVVNGNVVVPVNAQQIKHNQNAKVAFKQDISMSPAIQQDQFSSMPMVYEPEMEEKKKSSSNLLGLVTLGTIALGTSIYAFRQKGKVNQLTDDVAKMMKENETLKADTLTAKALADETIQKYENIAKDNETIKNSLNKEYTLSRWQRFIRWFNPESGLSKTEIEARNTAKKTKANAEKATKETKNAEKNATKETKKAEETTKPEESKPEETKPEQTEE